MRTYMRKYNRECPCILLVIIFILQMIYKARQSLLNMYSIEMQFVITTTQRRKLSNLGEKIVALCVSCYQIQQDLDVI